MPLGLGAKLGPYEVLAQLGAGGMGEVYRGGKWQISTEGGSHPTWSRNGRELFYESLDQRPMVALYAEQGGSFHADKPRLWVEARLPDMQDLQTFELHPDGQRFAVLQQVAEQGDTKRDKVVLFMNFFDELRRLAPTK